MRLIATTQCQPGEILGKTIYLDNGTVLVGEGVTLTQRMIDRLIHMNVTSMYIQDPLTADIEVEEVVSEQTRREAMGLINETFRKLQEDPKKFRNSFSNIQFGKQFRAVMSTVIDELKRNRSAMNLLGSATAADTYIFAHSFNVALYTTALALKAGYNEKELMDIGVGAMLHDIGKMALPMEVLNKPGRLTDEEYAIIQQHTVYGFDLIRQQDGISLLSAHCAFQHHERLDGTGYPRKLSGEQIHPYARLLSVCDVYDALTSHRVYRSPMLPHEAMEILYAGVNKVFFQNAVELMRDTIALYPIGLTVTLNTGETGVVVDYNQGYPSRPIVRIIRNEAGEAVTSPYEIDLSKQMTLMITACDAIS